MTIFANETDYRNWRDAKLENYPQNAGDLMVDIPGLERMSNTDVSAIKASCKRANMAIYRCQDHNADRMAVRVFASSFGLRQADHHLCANDDGVSELSVASGGTRVGYVPYSNRSLSWHTDGYYNEMPRRVNAVVLHCVHNADTGGENALLDPEIAYIHLRDKNPGFITALEHPTCMTIPANEDEQGEIRAAVSGPVFTCDSKTGVLHMRYSARKRNISWRDDELTRDALDCLTSLLANEDGPVIKYRLQPGEGLISNNILHNRTAFMDGSEAGRLLYRARFFERIESS